MLQNPISTHVAEAEQIAARFAAGVRWALTEEQFAEVCRRNGRRNWPACASHDFLDPNPIMHAAFVAVTGRDPLAYLNDEAAESGMSAADARLWSAAWRIATLSHLSTR